MKKIPGYEALYNRNIPCKGRNPFDREITTNYSIVEDLEFKLGICRWYNATYPFPENAGEAYHSLPENFKKDRIRVCKAAVVDKLNKLEQDLKYYQELQRTINKIKLA